jgi:hypothetical protein
MYMYIIVYTPMFDIERESPIWLHFNMPKRMRNMYVRMLDEPFLRACRAPAMPMSTSSGTPEGLWIGLRLFAPGSHASGLWGAKLGVLATYGYYMLLWRWMRMRMMIIWWYYDDNMMMMMMIWWWYDDDDMMMMIWWWYDDNMMTIWW